MATVICSGAAHRAPPLLFLKRYDPDLRLRRTHLRAPLSHGPFGDLKLVMARIILKAAILVPFLAAGPLLAQSSVMITEFNVGLNPVAITAGPDDNFWMWFSGTSVVGRMTPTGTLTIFPAGIFFPGATPAHCVDGRDGGVWFSDGGPIGRISTATGEATVFPLPSGSGATDMTLGPDGSLWFSDFEKNRIGRMTLAGAVTEYPLPTTFRGPHSITVGPDGAIWFTSDTAQVGRMEITGGGFRYFDLPESPGSIYAQFSAITTGSDGNLWLGVQLNQGGGNVVRVTPDGQVTEFPLPGPADWVLDIVAGPDGALWFTEEIANKIGRITTSGVLTEFPLPCARFFCEPAGITVGRDGAIWFTDLAGVVGRISGGPLARLTELSPAKVWVGVKNSDDVGLRLDLLVEVFVNGTRVGQGALDNVSAGSSGFSNAILNTIPLALPGGPVTAGTGSQFGVKVSARRTCSAVIGHNSGTARLWYNGPPVDSGAGRDAGSRFDATIEGTTSNYFLRSGSALSTTAGSAKIFADVVVNSAVACPARPFTSFGTWSVALP
jgi:virginiamycin B lyase